MGKKIIILLLIVAACKNVENSPSDKDIGCSAYNIYADSGIITYHTFDITKDCFDCKPHSGIILSAKNSFYWSLDTNVIVAILSEYPNDTMYMSIDSIGANGDCVKLSATLNDFQINTCGYFETTRMAYRVLKDADFFYYSFGTRYTLIRIKKRDPFEIRVYQKEFPQLPDLHSTSKSSS